MILNGSEISIGDSIIMPIDISTLATTRSMIRNGMKIRKPIWNAVFSSLVMKAGTSTVSGTSSGLSKPLPPEMRTNSREVALARLLQHELLQRLDAALQRGRGLDLLPAM